MLPVTKAPDLAAHLAALGVKTGDHLSVHARLLSFGLIDGGAETVFAALTRAVGPSGTIVMPSYTLARGTIYDPRTTPSQTVGAIVRGYKSSVTKQINILNNGVGVTHYAPTIIWQRNYHEHIIRNEQSYKTIADYIINNPAKWRDDKFFVLSFLSM